MCDTDVVPVPSATQSVVLVQETDLRLALYSPIGIGTLTSLHPLPFHTAATGGSAVDGVDGVSLGLRGGVPTTRQKLDEVHETEWVLLWVGKPTAEVVDQDDPFHTSPTGPP